jgi:hypothetical protein
VSIEEIRDREARYPLATATTKGEVAVLLNVAEAALAFRKAWSNPSDRSPWPEKLSKFATALDQLEALSSDG